MKKTKNQNHCFRRLLLGCFTALLFLIGLLPAVPDKEPQIPAENPPVELLDENPCSKNIDTN